MILSANTSLGSKEPESASVDVSLSRALHAFSSLGSSGNRSPTSASTQVDDATEIFSISPVAALDLLCKNIARLAKPDDYVPNPTDISDGPTRKENVSDGSEEASLKITKLHCVQSSNHASTETKTEATKRNILAKRFLSKRVPPIPLRDYILRLHRYCPMSTAVYLATSVYITKMAAVDKVLSITPRIVHRLVLAGLYVAVKALEDNSYHHSRFARVGGVCEQELSRLEMGFCFLVDFELRVDTQSLAREVRSIQGDPCDHAAIISIRGSS